MWYGFCCLNGNAWDIFQSYKPLISPYMSSHSGRCETSNVRKTRRFVERRKKLMGYVAEAWSIGHCKCRHGWNEPRGPGLGSLFDVFFFAKLWLNYIYRQVGFHWLPVTYTYFLSQNLSLDPCDSESWHPWHRRKTRVCMGSKSRCTWRIWMLQSRTQRRAAQFWWKLGTSLINSFWHRYNLGYSMLQQSSTWLNTGTSTFEVP